MTLLPLLLTAAVGSFTPPDSAGPCSVNTIQVGIPSGGKRVPGILYRPSAGDAESRQRPVVVFGHGYLAAANRYDSIFTRLASHGFYVLVPAYADPGLFRPAVRLADDMESALRSLDSLARIPGVNLDPRRVALVGHSMGGGAAFLAARRDTTGSVKAVAGLSPYRVSVKTEPESLRVPALVIAAQNDRTSTVRDVRAHFYEPCPTPCHYILIRAGGHNGYLDHTTRLEDRFEPFDRAVQLNAVRTCLTAFLQAYLAGDDRYRPWLEEIPLTDAHVRAEHK